MVIVKVFSSTFTLLECASTMLFPAGEDWESARKQNKTKMHILDPLALNLNLQKALNPDDLRLAQ